MQVRGLHRQGDTDSSGDSPTSYSNNVFANGGPTLGGAIKDLLGLADTVGITDDEARSIMEGRAALIANGDDPDDFEALEGRAVNPNTGGPPGAAPGSDAATGADSQTDAGIAVPESEWIRTANSGVNTRVLPEVWSKLEIFAQSLGRPIVLNSAYRSPAYNKKIGGAKKSMHMQRKACDVQWVGISLQGRINMIQKAIDAGFTGIGTYNNFMHVDIGGKRQWGSNGSWTGQYAQYKPVLKANGYANV